MPNFSFSFSHHTGLISLVVWMRKIKEVHLKNLIVTKATKAKKALTVTDFPTREKIKQRKDIEIEIRIVIVIVTDTVEIKVAISQIEMTNIRKYNTLIEVFL